MVKRRIWAIATFLLLAPALSMSDPSTLSRLELEITFSTSASVFGEFEKATIKTYDYPENDLRQSATCSVGSSTGTEGNRYATFTIYKDQPVEFSYTCRITSVPVGIKVTSPVPYPLSSIPPEAEKYLGESDYVKIDEAIAEKSLEIAEGKDELFDIASSLAYWVSKNIRYDLKYVDSSEDSIYVFRTRRGVCDEFSHLLIAMLRSLGIPARYVGGYSYGGAQNINSFGPHGWVEVYFPNYGWVPFDPTYGQFGWVDASHIKLYAGIEGFPVQETNYTYFGSPPSFSWNQREPSFTIISEREGFVPARLSLDLPEEAKKEEAFLAKASITNNAGTATLSEVRLFYKPTNLEDEKGLRLVYGNENSTVALFPLAPEEVSWVFIPSTPNYIFPVVAISGSQSEQKRITIKDGLPPATLSINTDKSGYGKGESAKVIFTISSQDYSGEAEVTELNSRISKKIRMGRGETRTAEMNVPATASLDFYSTSGNFKSVPLEISESSMFSRLEVPPKVELNAPFNVTILVSSKNPVQVRVEFEGQNEEKTVSPSAEFTFEKKLGASSILSATVTTSSSKNTLRRFVEVIAPLEIEVLPPNSIFNEPSLFTLNPKVSGASINSIQTSFPWGNYSGESFTLDPPVCGIHYYTVSINYTSSSGESGVKSVGNTINIDCNPLSRLIVKILKMLGIV